MVLYRVRIDQNYLLVRGRQRRNPSSANERGRAGSGSLRSTRNMVRSGFSVSYNPRKVRISVKRKISAVLVEKVSDGGESEGLKRLLRECVAPIAKYCVGGSILESQWTRISRRPPQAREKMPDSYRQHYFSRLE